MLDNLSSQVISPNNPPQIADSKKCNWIGIIQDNLKLLFADREDVLIAATVPRSALIDKATIQLNPDLMVFFDSGKGPGSFYPQVVFDLLTPERTLKEMIKKLYIYEKYGVLEYYLYDPVHNHLSGWQARKSNLEIIEVMDNWFSPLLGIRFQLSPEDCQIYQPNGERFLTFVELGKKLKQVQKWAKNAEQRGQMLEAKLRALGVELD